MVSKLSISIIFGAQLLSGCAGLTHLTRTRDLGESHFILIDAKQRAISSYSNINCAEPSPDALSALAASQGFNIATRQGTSVGESFALAESAGSIGLRTQSIQLLRDHMFRVCEAYQAGQLSPFMVALLHRRFQTSTVAILAIEQLTGTIRAPTIILGGSSSVGNADAIVKLSATRETSAALAATAEKDFAGKAAAADAADADLASKEAALKAAGTPAEVTAATTARDESKKADQDAQAEKLTADGIVTDRKAAVSALDRALTLAQVSGSASANGNFENTTVRNPSDITAIANAVSGIVRETLTLKNESDFCTVLLADAAQVKTKVDPSSPVVTECLKLLVSFKLTG